MTTGWQDLELGDVVTLQRGFDLPSRQRRSGSVPIVSSSGTTGTHDEPRVDAPGVVTGRYGTLGKVFFVNEPFWPLNTTLYVKDFHGNDPRFCFYFLQVQELKTRGGAAAVPGVNRNVLHRLPVRRPLLPTQCKIASILSAYDELIERHTRRIEILEEMAQRIYGEWFVDFRYPGHEDVPLRDSEIGQIPRGWELRRTSDLISRGCLAIGDGYRAKNCELGNQGLPFVRIGDLRDDFTFDGVDRLVPASIAAAGSKVSRDGDCVVSTKGSVGRVLMVPTDSPRFVYSPQLSYWRLLDQTLLREYLISWMRGPDFIRQCAQVKNATDMADYVNLRDQRRMLIPVPPALIQQEFQSVASPLLVGVANLWQSIRAARDSRETLLPRLMTGEIDVEDLDIEVPGVLA